MWFFPLRCCWNASSFMHQIWHNSHCGRNSFPSLQYSNSCTLAWWLLPFKCISSASPSVHQIWQSSQCRVPSFPRPSLLLICRHCILALCLCPFKCCLRQSGPEQGTWHALQKKLPSGSTVTKLLLEGCGCLGGRYWRLLVVAFLLIPGKNGLGIRLGLTNDLELSDLELGLANDLGLGILLGARNGIWVGCEFEGDTQGTRPWLGTGIEHGPRFGHGNLLGVSNGPGLELDACTW